MRNGPLRILCLRKAPLKFTWQKALQDAAYSVDSYAQVVHINDQTFAAPDVDVFIGLYGAAHHQRTIGEVMRLAGECRRANSSTLLFIAACDYSIDPVNDGDIVEAANKAGVSDPLDMGVFYDETALRVWLIDALEFALGVIRPNALLRQSSELFGENSQISLDEEGEAWPGPIF